MRGGAIGTPVNGGSLSQTPMQQIENNRSSYRFELMEVFVKKNSKVFYFKYLNKNLSKLLSEKTHQYTHNKKNYFV